MPSTHRLIGRQELARGAFILRIERHQLSFVPGEHILLGIKDDIERREYSLYSSADADHLAVLVKEVAGGSVSRRLRHAPIGCELVVEGPFGYFTLQRALAPHIFVATGTGVAPFHSYVSSYRDLAYTLIHGTRYIDERYGGADFANAIYCCSRQSGDHFSGRVTDYLRSIPLDARAAYYLCGNSDMIYEVFDILQQAEIPPDHIFAEVYF